MTLTRSIVPFGDAGSSRKALSEFGRDERGAVMLMGVFMACVLVGAMWFILGIGNALVFRDRMQEVADSVVFSSASVHARGMNFIAALNLIMMAVVAIHMAMGLVYYALVGIEVALGICAGTVAGAPFCGPFIGPVHSAGESVRNTWVSYMTGAKPVLISGAAIQSATSVLAPWGGQLAAQDVANRYGQSAFTLSPSMFPTIVPSFTPGGGSGSGATPGGSTASGASASAGSGGVDLSKPGPVDLSKPGTGSTGTFGVLPGKLGLPVEEQPFKFLCSHTAQAVLFWIKDALGGLPVVGSVINAPGIRSAVNAAIGIGGEAASFLLCNDTSGIGAPLPSVDIFWKGLIVGPKRMWAPARNGNDWLQVWGFVTDASYSDAVEKKVAIADGPQGLMGGTDPEIPTYNAQAEFYYDCNEGWTECNRNDTPAFSMRWKVRLRRFRNPNVGEMVAALGAEVLFSNGAISFLRSKVKNTGPFRSLETRIASFSGFKQTIGNKIVDYVNKPGKLENLGRKTRSRLASEGTPAGDGAYH